MANNSDSKSEHEGSNPSTRADNFKIKKMENSNCIIQIHAKSLFDDGFINGKNLFAHLYNEIPCINYIGGINGEKVFEAFMNQYRDLVETIYTYKTFDKSVKRYDFGETFIILKNGCIIEANTWYFEIYHTGVQSAFIEECTKLVAKFKERNKRKPLEINLVVSSRRGFELREMEVKRTKLDLDLFYEDDFKVVDEVIRKRLGQKNDKGIVLLHGLPGTGKTTYLRYLIGKMKKRILFLSPNIAGNLVNPDFIELLINNPNTVLVIEDAENIIKDRRTTNDSAVSNLLNISDGLLADFLNVQLICTFNSPLTLVDSALMRKGRLIAKYEFGKLSINKAQKLSDHLKYDSVITRPMTVAEVTNQHEQVFETKQVNVIGFRREAEFTNN